MRNRRAHRTFARWTAGLAAVFMVVSAVHGCAYLKRPRVQGLEPMSPEVFVVSETKAIVFTQVDWLRPLLRWKAFERPEGRKGEGFGKITAVTYDIKVWELAVEKQERFVTGVGVELVYERTGLVEPMHRIERELKAGTGYLWTVRARFELDGKPRATVWTLSRDPVPTFTYNVVPHPNLLRFRTPYPEEDRFKKFDNPWTEESEE